MALFIDGEVSSLQDLRAHDSQVLDVASIEGIDVTQKLAVAQDELALELEILLGALRSGDRTFWLRAETTVDNVVCTPALRLWHRYRTLELVYSDAYYSQLNDRYKAKRDQFHEKARWAREKVTQAGLGIAWHPVHRAATPEVSASPGGGLPDGTYYVTMAWVNASGEEGACATPACITTAGSTVVVRPQAAPGGATGWNIYLGMAPEALWQQNVAPIAPGETWQQTGMPLAGGRTSGDGQLPSYIQPIPFLIQRG